MMKKCPTLTPKNATLAEITSSMKMTKNNTIKKAEEGGGKA